jgi:hypothetical protein
MKKNDRDRRGSASKLELHRETLRRLDPAALENVLGGREAYASFGPRPTTDP